MTDPIVAAEARTELIVFCPCCFASTDNSSQGGTLTIGGCMNCGSGPNVSIPRWAVESIRSQASWVGRRYYPSDEDKEITAERQALLATVKVFPGRTVELPRDGSDPTRWTVTQRIAGSRTVSTTVKATTAEEALEASRYLLRYVPEAVAPAPKPSPLDPSTMNTGVLMTETAKLLGLRYGSKQFDEARLDALMAECERRGIRWEVYLPDDAPSGGGN